ncbi:hypothetical protein C0995_015410 [Termitomyces sp. Mi166|nr:hypothetical protein C0995_015410 [Termitomyces sp. Mi166\
MANLANANPEDANPQITYALVAQYRPVTERNEQENLTNDPGNALTLRAVAQHIPTYADSDYTVLQIPH